MHVTGHAWVATHAISVTASERTRAGLSRSPTARAAARATTAASAHLRGSAIAAADLREHRDESLTRALAAVEAISVISAFGARDQPLENARALTAAVLDQGHS